MARARGGRRATLDRVSGTVFGSGDVDCVSERGWAPARVAALLVRQCLQCVMRLRMAAMGGSRRRRRREDLQRGDRRGSPAAKASASA